MIYFFITVEMIHSYILNAQDIYGSFHIRLTVDVADLNEIIFLRFFINNKETRIFLFGQKNFFYKYTIFRIF